MDRLEFWSEDKVLSIGKENTSLFDLMEMCREVIFDWVEGRPIFHLISLQIDFENKSAKHGHEWSTTLDFDSQKDQDEEVKTIIAYAITLELPVYPNSPLASEKLIPYWKEVLTNGFEAPHEDDSVRLVLSDDAKADLIDLDSYLKADFSHIRTPVELQIQRTFIQKEFEKLSQADKILKLLEVATRQLTDILEKTHRNENELQRCLTENPILFGLDYLRVIPKHRLGSEYEMDYALERINGAYDLVEIEASNLPLYTQGGNPSQHLVHAEQQVYDWLEWVENNSPYAREKLPGLISPIGFVIMGRSRELNESNKIKLRRRNKILEHKLTILTYDDLLDRTRKMHQILSS